MSRLNSQQKNNTMSFTPKVNEKEQPVKIDSATANISYVGYAQSQAEDADEKWAIKRISVSNGVMTIAWAGGTIEKKYRWSQRSSLTYKIL